MPDTVFVSDNKQLPELKGAIWAQYRMSSFCSISGGRKFCFIDLLRIADVEAYSRTTVEVGGGGGVRQKDGRGGDRDTETDEGDRERPEERHR